MSPLVVLTPFVVSAALTAALALYAWARRTRVPGARPLAGLALAETAWTLLYLAELLADHIDAKFLADRLQNVPMTLGATCALALALRQSGRTVHRPGLVWTLLAAAPAPVLGVAIAEAAGGPARRALDLLPAPPYGALFYPMGADDAVLGGWSLLLVGAAVGLLLASVRRRHRAHRARAAALALAIALPALGLVAGVALGFRFLGQRDPTPPLFAVATLLEAWAVFGRRIGDLVPVARDLVVGNLPDPVLVLDARDRLAEANRAAARFLSAPVEAAIGRPAAEVIPCWPDLARLVHDVGRNPGLGAAGRLAFEGASYDVRSAVVGARGQPAGHALVLHDITAVDRANVALRAAREDLERRVAERTAELTETAEWLRREVTERGAAEAAARDAAQKLQALFDNAFQLVGMVTPAGEVVSVNRTTLEVTGAVEEELVGRPLWEMPGVRDDPAQQAQVQDAARRAAAGEFVRFAGAIRARDGTPREVDVSVKPVCDARGRPTLLVFEARDVTELRRAERDRRELERRVEQVQRFEAIGRFAAGIGHDFNDLLTVVLANAKLARADAPPGSDLAELLDELTAAAQDAAELTRELLAFGRRRPVPPEPVDLGAEVARLERLLAAALGERIALRTRVAPGATALLDPGALEHVLVQLATRAREALPEGGTFAVEADEVVLGEAEARASGVGPGRFVRVVVADRPRAPDAAHGRSGEPVDGTAAGAAALGITTVRIAVEQGGGVVDVRSEGGGTRFEVLFPAAAPRAAEPPAAREEVVGGQGERVVVVEDQEPVRAATVRILTKLGYRVAAYGRAGDALAAIAETEPVDLLLTDVQMPDLSGPALAEAARRERPGLAVLYVSGFVDEGDPAVSSAADGHFLSKPFTPAALAEAVRRALRSRSGDDEDRSGARGAAPARQA